MNNFFLHLISDGKCVEVDTEYCSPATKNKMPRTRTNLHHIKAKNSPLSPTGSDSAGHRLRPRNSLTNNYVQHFVDLDDELKLEDLQSSRELRSSARQSSIQVLEVCWHFYSSSLCCPLKLFI